MIFEIYKLPMFCSHFHIIYEYLQVGQLEMLKIYDFIVSSEYIAVCLIEFISLTKSLHKS